MQDWRESLAAAIALEPDHISAYALVVEQGTKLAAQVRRGQVPAPEDDDEAAKYEIADEVLAAAGYRWYEVSNWARTDEDRCRHNEGYWTDGSWWGVGPGAHSHVGGVRWWNVKHPNAFATRVGAGQSPAAGRELLTDEQRYDELVLLGVRRVDGLDVTPCSRRDVRPWRASSPTGWSHPRPALAQPPGRADQAGHGCSPTPWCAGCSASDLLGSVHER